jgi:hypothetical protein
MAKTTASAKIDTTPSGSSVSVTINSGKAEVRLNAQGPPPPKKLPVRRPTKDPMLSLPAPCDAI